MTGEQWQAAWIICETAADMDPAAREEYIRGVTVDPDVERQVLEVLEELSLEPVFPSAPDPHGGDSIGRYIVGERIGQGGMGQVYSARDTELDREVAIKFLPADLPLETAASQIIREGRSASSLNHPNIVTVTKSCKQSGDSRLSWSE
jgi:serine/threonine protein kinase